jgi:cytochrome c-type biogenesis protein CcmF
MMAYLGYCTLFLALLLALGQSGFLFASDTARWISKARVNATMILICLLLALGVLILSFLRDDFTIAYVAQNSHPSLPKLYKICAVWAGHEGSMLLWITLLSAWSVCYAYCHRSLSTLAVLGFIQAGFLLFLLWTSNPFVWVVNYFGRDLNPLLQDPGLSFHPPLLYLGYVGFSVTFAITVAYLLRAQTVENYLMQLRVWTLASWGCLTLGIAGGSWWAYRVLGWGGWWFWDPVENAALLPWLTSLGLIHAIALAQRQQCVSHWVLLFSIATFALSIMGTFLVRSGLLISVHSFATDPNRGVFILILFALWILPALFLYAFRAPFRVNSRCVKDSNEDKSERWLFVNNSLMSVMAVTIFLGTLYPLGFEVLGLGKLSVGAPYFNTMLVPLFLVMLFFMGWMHAQTFFTLKNVGSFFLALGLAGVIGLLESFNYVAFVVLTLILWMMITLIVNIRPDRWRQQGGMIFAHLGVAITALGICVSHYYGLQQDTRMFVGEQFKLGSYQMKFADLYPIQNTHYQGLEANILITKHDRMVASLHPQLRYFATQDIALSKPETDATLWRDFYVALSRPLSENVWSLRFYYKPLIRWIWLGGVLMMLGGLFALFKKRVN